MLFVFVSFCFVVVVVVVNLFTVSWVFHVYLIVWIFGAVSIAVSVLEKVGVRWGSCAKVNSCVESVLV